MGKIEYEPGSEVGKLDAARHMLVRLDDRFEELLQSVPTKGTDYGTRLTKTMLAREDGVLLEVWEEVEPDGDEEIAYRVILVSKLGGVGGQSVRFEHGTIAWHFIDGVPQFLDGDYYRDSPDSMITWATNALGLLDGQQRVEPSNYEDIPTDWSKTKTQIR